ncbi:hypothetical protein L7F22_021815 [Adiantum nelumboides]|nr:hypothetical protein [Adiantum nelumboides]
MWEAAEAAKKKEAEEEVAKRVKAAHEAAFGSSSSSRSPLVSPLVDHSSPPSPKSPLPPQNEPKEESTTRQYDEFLEKFVMSGSNPEAALDCSDYFGPVEIQMTADGRGRGLFATKDIKAGKLVIVCKAVAFSGRKDQHSIETGYDFNEETLTKLVKSRLTISTSGARDFSEELNQLSERGKSIINALKEAAIPVLRLLKEVYRQHEIVPTELIERIAGLKHGGTYKNVKTLLRHKLVHHDSSKYDGYRLTNLGYDFLAIKTMANRGLIVGVGRQIGIGKESDIFEVVSEDGQTLALKLHRLGRTSFRAVKSKRDYLKHRNSFNWLYLSRLAALKEYAFMKALGDHGFPVPKAVDWNRHCVLMSLVPGYPLVQVKQLQNPTAVFETILALIVRLASHGLIHCDFNEFNIMIDDKEAVTMIDFPQMVSVSHRNAEMYFDRDVECILKFFNKRFRANAKNTKGGQSSELSFDDRPDFETVANLSASLDKQLEASGFTHQDQKDLEEFIEGMIEDDAGSNEGGNDDSKSNTEEDISEDENKSGGDGDDAKSITEEDISEDENKSGGDGDDAKSSIETIISEQTSQLGLGCENTCPIEETQDAVRPEENSLHHFEDGKVLSDPGLSDAQRSKGLEKQRKRAVFAVRSGTRYNLSRNASKDKGGRRFRHGVGSKLDF